MKLSLYTRPGDSVCFSIISEWVTEQCVHINSSESQCFTNKWVCFMCHDSAAP